MRVRERTPRRHSAWRFASPQHVQCELFDAAAQLSRVTFNRAQLRCHRFEAGIGVGRFGHTETISNLLAISLALGIRSTQHTPLKLCGGAPGSWDRVDAGSNPVDGTGPAVAQR